MKNNNTIISLAAIFFSCFVLSQQVDAASSTGPVHFSSSVRLGRVEASRSSRLRVASARLQASRIGSSLAMNSQVQISGPVTLGENGRFNGGALTMNNGYIGGSATMRSNVHVRGSINGEADSDIGIGGMQITADENYNPLVSLNSMGLGSQERIGVQSTHSIEDDWTYQMIKLSDCSYRNHTCSALPRGWKDADLDKLGLDRAKFEDPESGFYARLFYNEKARKYVLGFEGTNEKKDWIKGNTQAALILVPQYQKAVELAYLVNKQLGKNNLSFTGHSLGGGLASMAAMITGHKAITFNAAGISKPTVQDAMRRYSFTATEKKAIYKNWNNRNKLVTAYTVKGDKLTQAQWLTLGVDNAIGRHVQLPNLIDSAHGMPDNNLGKIKYAARHPFQTADAALQNTWSLNHGIETVEQAYVQYYVQN